MLLYTAPFLARRLISPRESLVAVRHWFGVSPATVRKWRRALESRRTTRVRAAGEMQQHERRSSTGRLGRRRLRRLQIRFVAPRSPRPSEARSGHRTSSKCCERRTLGDRSRPSTARRPTVSISQNAARRARTYNLLHNRKTKARIGGAAAYAGRHGRKARGKYGLSSRLPTSGGRSSA